MTTAKTAKATATTTKGSDTVSGEPRASLGAEIREIEKRESEER